MPVKGPILCLAGPTAAGKSAATKALAAHWPIEVISVDSAAIYRGMDIGTAKPSAAEQAAIPHHLLDIRDPAEAYSVAEFVKDATALIDQIQQRQHHPILCGGTMMYYNALFKGLSPLPPADPALRATLDQQAAQIGWPAMHQKLAQQDPVTAKRLAPNDSQRIQRALEVLMATGKPLSAWLAETPQAMSSSHQFITLSLEPSVRAELHRRIEKRFHQMMAAGFLSEVQQLYDRGDLHVNLPAIRCVGYRQLWEHLDGAYDEKTAVERGIIATRQLAKRQLTWLRGNPQRHIIDCLHTSVPNQVVNFYGTLLKTG